MKEKYYKYTAVAIIYLLSVGGFYAGLQMLFKHKNDVEVILGVLVVLLSIVLSVCNGFLAEVETDD